MIIEAVVYQHHEECGVHFNRLSLINPFLGLSNYIGEDIADLTTKANASLDGLRIAVQDGWDPFDPDSMEEPIVPGMKGEDREAGKEHGEIHEKTDAILSGYTKNGNLTFNRAVKGAAIAHNQTFKNGDKPACDKKCLEQQLKASISPYKTAQFGKIKVRQKTGGGATKSDGDSSGATI